MKDKAFTIPLPDDLKEWLVAHAKEQDASMSQIIRRAIREYMKSKEAAK
jgi:predicted transcriptional regulator